MKKRIIVIVFCLFLLCGCSKNEENNVLNVLNWSSYIPQEIIDKFEKETGIKVNYSTYSSNEELLAKVSASGEGTYDLVFPSDYMVELMKQKDMLMKIDRDKISNYSNINMKFLNKNFDVYNDYSIPFLAATCVIAYNTDNIKEDITGYSDLLNSRYKNDIVMVDDSRIVIGAALLANGYDMNSISSNEIKFAKSYLLNLKRNIKAYDSDSPKTFLITNETNIAFTWNAEALIAKKENSNIRMIYPKEGFALSLDNFVLLKGSKHSDNAYKFIDFILREDINSLITDEYPYINVTYSGQNVEEQELDYIMKNGVFVRNVGEHISLYDKTWAQIK